MSQCTAILRRRSSGSARATPAIPTLVEPTRRRPLALVAHPQEWSARSLESVLSVGGYTVARAATGPQAVEVARRTLPDLILLDAGLPDLGGVEACRTLCGDARIGASTPIVILLRDPATREQRLAGLRAGAWECVGLPLDTEELLLKLDAYVRAKSHADAAREESLVDEASGLYNLRGLLRRIREMGGEACRHRRPLACVVFALDGGEADAAGRGAGARARAAQAVPRLLGLFQDAARSSDVVGRLGETEFVVLAPGTDAAGALQLARRLLAAAEAVDAERKGAPTLRLRAGCHAVADFCNAGIEPVEMLVRAAQALRALPAGMEAERIRFFPSPGRAVAS